MIEKTHMSTMQAADLIGCSRQTIWLAIGAGQFPTAMKSGRAWMLPVDEVYEFHKYYHSTEFEDESEDID